MSNSKKLRTPIIKPRTQGGTFYTFGSAMEDIGLNINELRNRVSLSHYVLLDLPEMPDVFNPLSTSTFESVNVGDYKFAEGFQNYVLNMETVMRNQSTYNFATSQTVSERVFWKWLSKSCMNFVVDPSSNDYYIDDNQVVKGFGAISAGAQRTDDYSMYNETFVQIPSSYGQMKVLFKKVEDSNYFKKTTPYYATSTTGLIENISQSEVDAQGKLSTGISGHAVYDSSIFKSYSVTSDSDSLCVEFSLDKLREYYEDDTVTYDDLAIKDYYSGFTNTNYSFNAILVYYSIYDSTGSNLLATNAYGILLLNSCETYGTNSSYKFPELVKSKSTSTTSGTSYAFRLNTKTSSVYSGDIYTNDNATAAYSMSTDFNDVLKNLSASINILRSNSKLISLIASDNDEIKSLSVQALEKVEELEKSINSIKNGEISHINSNSIATKYLDASILLANTNILDSEDNVIGEINDEHFYYDTIDASTVNADVMKSGYIETDSAKVRSGFSVKNYSSDETYGKITNNGLSSKNTFHKIISVPQSATVVSGEDVGTVLESTNIKFKNNSYYIELPSTVSSESAQVLLNALKQNIDSTTYLNINAFLAFLACKVKSFSSTTATSIPFTDASFTSTNVAAALKELNAKIESYHPSE